MPEENRKICPGCGADLTKPGSVSRDYIATGFYNENGDFERSGSLEIIEAPDLCASCLDAV